MPAKSRRTAASLSSAAGASSSMEHDRADARQTRFTIRTAVLVALGLAAIGALLYHVGAGEVARLLASLGWRAPLILAPFAVISYVDALGWARALGRAGRRQVSLWRLYLIRHAGEAVNNLTPTAGLGGEPLKAYLLRRHGVAAEDGIASVVIAKTAVVSSQFAFTIVGLLFFLDHLGVLRERALMLIGGAFVALAVTFVLVAGQRRGLIAGSVRVLERFGARWRWVRRLEAKAAGIDEALLRFYRDDPRGFAVATGYHLVGWLLGAAEVMFFFYLLGVPCDWRQALVVESLTQATMAAAAFAPGGLGVQEVSGTLLCRLVGLGEAPGAAVMLLKRAREIAFSALGVWLASWLSRGRS